MVYFVKFTLCTRRSCYQVSTVKFLAHSMHFDESFAQRT